MIPQQIVKSLAALASQLNALQRELEVQQQAEEHLPVPESRQKLKKQRKDKYRAALITKK